MANNLAVSPVSFSRDAAGNEQVGEFLNSRKGRHGKIIAANLDRESGQIEE
jgi:hypothetical protein